MLQQPEQRLSVSYDLQAEGTVVKVAGVLHLPNAEQFREPLQSVIDGHAGTVLIDFRQVIFMDSAGLNALVDIRKQLSLQSRPLSLFLFAGSQPDRVMRTSRMDTILTLIYE